MIRVQSSPRVLLQIPPIGWGVVGAVARLVRVVALGSECFVFLTDVNVRSKVQAGKLR